MLGKSKWPVQWGILDSRFDKGSCKNLENVKTTLLFLIVSNYVILVQIFFVVILRIIIHYASVNIEIYISFLNILSNSMYKNKNSIYDSSILKWNTKNGGLNFVPQF
jgi:hypothetical protein